MIRSIALALTLVGGLVACQTEVDNKPAGEVKEVTEAPKAPAPAGDMNKVDVANSKIEFVGAKVTGQHAGGFKSYTGSVGMKDGKVASTNFTIDMDSTYSDSEKLTKHLKAPDFFDIEKFPKANFTSTKIEEKAGPEGATHSVTGTFDFHGVKKELTFPATITVQDKAAALNAKFTIKRMDWGVAYKGKADDLIKDEVLIKLDLKFPGA